MSTKPSKSAVIRAMYATGSYTVAEIAWAVGCRPEYVRVVARQRIHGGLTKSEAAARTALDRETRNAIRRAAYAAARKAGSSVLAAISIASCAVHKAGVEALKARANA